MNKPRNKKLLKAVFVCAIASVLLLLYAIGKSQSKGETPHQANETTEGAQHYGCLEDYIAGISESGLVTEPKLLVKAEAYCEYELADGIILVAELNDGYVDTILLKASIGEPPERPEKESALAQKRYIELTKEYEKHIDAITDSFTAAAMSFGGSIKPSVTQIDEMSSLISLLLHSGKKSEKRFGVFTLSAYEIYGGSERQIRIRLD